MDPIPPTVEALQELARQGDVSLGIELHAVAARVRAVVPELIGLSLGVVQDGITLTLVASAEQAAALDFVQYVDGGPCVAAAETAEVIDVTLDDMLDEGRWQLYAQASAAAGVASSLSLPVMEADRVVGGVNLYASTADAFVGRHREVAEAVGSEASFAVSNADLSFLTIRQAAEAPARVRDSSEIHVALGIIAQAHRVAMTVARERLRDAAARAGISEAQAARVIRSVQGL